MVQKCLRPLSLILNKESTKTMGFFNRMVAIQERFPEKKCCFGGL